MLMHKPCIFFRYGSIEIYGVKQQIDVYGLKGKYYNFKKTMTINIVIWTWEWPKKKIDGFFF